MVGLRSTVSVLLYANGRTGQDHVLEAVRCLRDQDTASSGLRIGIVVLLCGGTSPGMALLEQVARGNRDWLEIVSLPRDTPPGAAWNAGLERSTGDLVCFGWPGVRWLPDSFAALAKLLFDADADAAYGPLACETSAETADWNDRPLMGAKPAHAAWVQMINLAPLAYTLWRRGAIVALGGFRDGVPARLADWDLFRRAAATASLAVLTGTPISSRWSLATLPLDLDPPLLPTEREVRLTLQWSVPAVRGAPADGPRRAAGPYRVAVVSGLYEGAQVQLCLLNHLEPLAAAGFVEWRVFFDEHAAPESFRDYDVVFFVRSRTVEARRIAAACFERGIRTVYLLDDNWFHAVETYPQLDSQIGPGTAAFRHFVTLLGSVDFGLTYSELLRGDLSAFNERTILFPINVELAHFPPADRRDDGRLRVGFAGSSSRTQFVGPPFEAVAQLMAERPQVDLVLRGLEPPKQLKGFGSRVRTAPYVFDYKRYAREVARSRLDVMLSPLGESRYTSSQCPNKYLEITAAGAVGIYSDVSLYRQVVRSGENGVLAGPHRDDWHRALIALADDPGRRRRMWDLAREDVENRYSTPKVVGRFLRLLDRVVEGPVNDRDLDFEQG